MSKRRPPSELPQLVGRALELANERREKFKFKRWVAVSTAYASQKDQDGRKLCSRCLAPLDGRRKRWCSDACVTDAMVHCNMQASRFVFHRDRGVCAVCRLDVVSLRRAFKLVVRSFGDPFSFQKDGRSDAIGRLCALGFSPDTSRRWWEVDHVVPVIEGGGFCGLDGLRTLCLLCHRKATAELASRRAAQRRMA